MEAYAHNFSSQSVGFVIASDQPQDNKLFSDDVFNFTTEIAGGPGIISRVSLNCFFATRC